MQVRANNHVKGHQNFLTNIKLLGWVPMLVGQFVRMMILWSGRGGLLCMAEVHRGRQKLSCEAEVIRVLDESKHDNSQLKSVHIDRTTLIKKYVGRSSSPFREQKRQRQNAQCAQTTPLPLSIHGLACYLVTLS